TIASRPSRPFLTLVVYILVTTAFSTRSWLRSSWNLEGGMIDGIGPMQLVLVLLVVLLLFGNRIPEVMRSLGSGIKEFKKGVSNPEPDAVDSGASSDESRETTP